MVALNHAFFNRILAICHTGFHESQKYIFVFLLKDNLYTYISCEAKRECLLKLCDQQFCIGKRSCSGEIALWISRTIVQ